MIPYWQPPKYELGPFTLEVFGVFVAIGIYLAARITTKRAEEDGLDGAVIGDFALWGVGAGLVVGHLFHLFLYHPEELDKGPFQILRVWDGLSSFGGLVGGILGAAVYFRVKKLSFRAYADAFALGVAPGWAVARLGCFAVHDHPGVRTDFFLAVNFPPPVGPRHDLGLYDAAALFLMAAVLWLLRKRKLLRGRLLPLLALMYAPQRFASDFLRASDLDYVDKRYGGLTPAQYLCLFLVAYGIYGLLAYRTPSTTRPWRT